VAEPSPGGVTVVRGSGGSRLVSAHPAELPDVEGMDKLGYVDGLFAHLAAADRALRRETAS